MESLLSRELQKLGLADKESRVYLASLELGYAPIQDIAKKADINRATTYVIMDQLIHKGVAAHFNKGKKRYFVAESPDKLMGLLRIKERELQEQRREYDRILPELRSLYNLSDNKPKVLFYEGIEGIRSIRKTILDSGVKEIYSIAVPDDFNKHFVEDTSDDNFDDVRVQNGITTNIIYTRKVPVTSEPRLAHRYWLPSGVFSLESDITIFGNRVALVTLRDTLSGVVIENQYIANTMRTLWQSLNYMSTNKIWENENWNPSQPSTRE